MRAVLNKVLVSLAVALGAATLAMAAPDTFFIGTGRSNSRTVSDPNTVVNSYAPLTAAAAVGSTEVTVLPAEAAAFAQDDLVMIIQMTGLSPAPDAGVSPVSLANSGVGGWELARVVSIDGGTIRLNDGLVRSYGATGAQLVKVPEYQDLTIDGGASIVPGAWDGGAGGVLALMVSGRLINNGLIDATGRGFRGGASGAGVSGGGANCNPLNEAGARPQKGEGISHVPVNISGDVYGQNQGRGNLANGGGAGTCNSMGGGGGSNTGQGGNGASPETEVAQGGAALTYSLPEAMVMGGGGGAGHGTATSGADTGGPGGTGGGIVFIRAGQLEGTGSIRASGTNGGDGNSAGGGGGGAGGTIQVRLVGFAQCGAIQAEGGVGGNQGTDAGANTRGGQGSGGAVLFHAGITSGCALSVDGGTNTSGTLTVLDGGLTQLASPVVTSPGSGALINTAQPTVSGLAPVPSDVVISLVDGGTLVGGGRTARGTTQPNGTFGVQLSLPGSGTYVIQAASEREGLQSLKSPPTTFTVDLDRPVVTILGPTGTTGPTATRNPVGTFGFTSNETMRQYECQLAAQDAGITDAGFAVCQPLTTFDAGSDGGRYTVWVRGTDLAGNTNSPLALHDWAVDTQAPVRPVIQSPDAGSYVSTASPIIVAGRAEPASGVLVYFNGVPQGSFTGALADGGWSHPLSPTPNDGFYVLTATATDSVGNTSVFSDPVSFLVDGTPPGAPVILTPLEDARFNTRDAGVSGVSEPGSQVSVQVREVGQSSVLDTRTQTADGQGRWDVVLAMPAQGTPPAQGVEYEARAVARDMAGNASTDAGTRRFWVDLVAPSVTLNGGPSSPTNSLEAQFTFTASEPVQFFDCQLDNGAAVTCASPYSLRVPDAGTYTLTVRAVDLAGNRTAADAGGSATWTVDRGAPAAPAILTPANESFTTETRPIVSGTAEGDSAVQVYLNGAPWLTAQADGGVTGGWSVRPGVSASLNEGFYLLHATATDRAGNTGPSSAVVSFTVDNTRPGTPVVTSPAAQAYVNTAAPTLLGTAEPFSRVDMLLSAEDAGTITRTISVGDGGTWSLPLSGLTDGLYRALVTATDRANNTSLPTNPAHEFTVDTLPPDAPVWAPDLVNAHLATRSPVLRGTVSGAGLDVVVSVNDAGVGTVRADDAGTWSIFVPGPLREDSHSASAVARDRAGNTSDAGVLQFTVDVTRPDTEILRGPPQDTSLSTVDFDVRSPDPSVTEFECSKNRASFVDCNATLNPDAGVGVYAVTMTGFELGDAGVAQQEVLIRAIDRAGNVDDTPDSHSWRMVSGVLTVGIVIQPDEFINATEALYSFTSQRPGAGFRGTLTNITSGQVTIFSTGLGVNTYSFDNLAEGEYELRVRATDGENESGEISARRFTVDRTAPDAATDIEPAPNARVRAGGSFRGSAEPRTTVELRIPGRNGVTVALVPVQNDGTWTRPFGSDLEDGENTITVTVVDPATNPSPSVDRTFVYDSVPPRLTTFGRPPAVTSDTTPDFNVVVSEAVSYECTLDNVVADCATPTPRTSHSFTLSANAPLEDGVHSMTLTLRDEAGNENATPIFYSWSVDTVAPDTFIDVAPDRDTRQQVANFRFRSTEPPATYACRLDGRDIPCTEQFQVPTPEERSYTLTVAALDQAQNRDDSAASFTWTVDRTAPVDPVVEVPAEGEPVRNAAATFSGTAEPNSVVSVLVNDVPLSGEATADTAGRWTFVAQQPLQLEQGLHVVQARARDAAGNLSNASAGRTFLFDTLPPATDIVSGPEEGERVRAVSVTFRFSSEQNATYRCSVDNEEKPCGEELLIDTPEERFYSLRVQAVDAAGNVDPVGKTRRWRVYLGNDLRTRGGGLSCATTTSGGPPALLLALGVLALLAARRRR